VQAKSARSALSIPTDVRFTCYLAAPPHRPRRRGLANALQAKVIGDLIDNYVQVKRDLEVLDGQAKQAANGTY